MTTNVPVPVFGPAGFIAPLESALNAGAFADIEAAFSLVPGATPLNPSPATPQGVLAAAIAAMIGNNNNIFLQFTNLVDPALSYGLMQDAIGRLYFIERIEATATVAICTCIGAQGVTIPVGALAQAADQNIYVCQQAGTFTASGVLYLPFACQVLGAIVCPASSVNSIYQAIPGWDSINNPSAGATGNNVESPQAFETRRGLSVAINAVGWLAAVMARVLSVPGVLDAFSAENDAGTSETVGGMTLLPNSIYVAVLGGDTQAVAMAIWQSKMPGCIYNGNTSVTVYDTNPLYSPPYPAYTVLFEIPAPLPFVVVVNMLNNSLVPSNALTLVQNDVVAAFAGQDVIGFNAQGQEIFGNRQRIGQRVFAGRFYQSLTLLWPGATVVSVFLGNPNLSSSSFTASISGTTMTVSGVTTGTLAANQYLFDLTGDITPGTYIVNQSTGPAGGTGTYIISPAQTVVVASEAVTGVVASYFDTAVNINQWPTVSAANVVLNLVSS